MPSPIPVRLGDQAVRLAQHYGVSRISKTLCVGYYPLANFDEKRNQFSDEIGSQETVLGHAPISPGLSLQTSWNTSCHSSENARIDRAAAWAANRSVHPFSRGHFVFQRRCGTAPVCPEFWFRFSPYAATPSKSVWNVKRSRRPAAPRARRRPRSWNGSHRQPRRAWRAWWNGRTRPGRRCGCNSRASKRATCWHLP